MATKDGTARVRVQAVGREQVKAVLAGIRQETRKTSDEAKRLAREQERATNKAAREQEQAAKRAARVQEQEAKKGARAQIAEARKVARETETAHKRAQAAIAREAEKSARAQKRAQERAAREFARERERAGQLTERTSARASAQMSAGAGWAIGGGAAAIGAVLGTVGSQLERVISTLESRAGVQTLDESIASGQEFELGLTRLGNQAFGQLGTDEYNARIAETRDRIFEVARATAVAPGELLEGLMTFQDRFSDFDFGVASMRQLAEASQATGTPLSELVEVLGEARRQFGLANDESREFLAVLTEQGEAGSVKPMEFARNFGSEFGAYKRLTGRTGIQAVREFGALSQIQAAGGGTTAVAATRQRGMFQQLGNAETQRRLRRFSGIRVQTNAQGQIDDLPALLEEMASNRRLRDPRNLQKIFTDIEGREGIGILLDSIRTRRGGPDDPGLRDIMNVDSAAGAQQLDAAFNRVAGTADMKQKLAMMPSITRDLAAAPERGNAQLEQMMLRRRMDDTLPGAREWVGSIPVIGGIMSLLERASVATDLTPGRGKGGLMGAASLLLPGAQTVSAALQDRNILGSAQSAQEGAMGFTGTVRVDDAPISDASAQRIGNATAQALRDNPPTVRVDGPPGDGNSGRRNAGARR